MADLKKDGVDFSANLIVPEIDATTKEKLHQREDHNHILKRIVGCIREGKIPGFNVVFLRDALHDPNLIVPEIDATTKEKLHQREDHNHILK